jgi:hypothetical protein
MPKPSARVLCLLLALFAAAIFLWPAPPAEALFPVAYSWSCTSRNCSFSVTTTNHGAYKWGFGDGTSSSKTTSTTANHFYNTPVDDEFHTATVTLSAYASLSSPSPDNIIGCNIVYAASYVGIGTSGSCS